MHATLLASRALPGLGPVRHEGHELLGRLEVPEPWASDLRCAVARVDPLDGEIDGIEKALRALGADHPFGRSS